MKQDWNRRKKPIYLLKLNQNFNKWYKVLQILHSATKKVDCLTDQSNHIRWILGRCIQIRGQNFAITLRFFSNLKKHSFLAIFAFSDTKSIEIDYSGLSEHQLFSARFYGIVLCAAPPPPQSIGPIGQNDHFYVFFATKCEFVAEIGKEHGFFLHIFQCNNIQKKPCFLRLEKNLRLMAEF